jgi:hypothetical protein
MNMLFSAYFTQREGKAAGAEPAKRHTVQLALTSHLLSLF